MDNQSNNDQDLLLALIQSLENQQKQSVQKRRRFTSQDQGEQGEAKWSSTIPWNNPEEQHFAEQSSSSSSSSSSASTTTQQEQASSSTSSERKPQFTLHKMPRDLTAHIAGFLSPKNAATVSSLSKATQHALKNSFRAKERDLRPYLQQRFRQLMFAQGFHDEAFTQEERQQIQSLFQNNVPITTEAEYRRVLTQLNSLLTRYLIDFSPLGWTAEETALIDNHARTWFQTPQFMTHVMHALTQGDINNTVAHSIVKYASPRQLNAILENMKTIDHFTREPFADVSALVLRLMIRLAEQALLLSWQAGEHKTCPPAFASIRTHALEYSKRRNMHMDEFDILLELLLPYGHEQSLKDTLAACILSKGRQEAQWSK